MGHGVGIYKLFAADPQAGEVGFIGTLREDGLPVALSMRLKVENKGISEVDMLMRSERTAKLMDDAGSPDPILFETIFGSGEEAAR